MINLEVTRRVVAARLLLRPGSVEPADLHDRRQHRRELGRRALPEVRVHRPSRAWALEVVLPDGDLAQIGGKRARRARSRSPGRHRRVRRDARGRHQGDAPDPAAARRPCARCSPRSTSTEAAGDAVSEIISAGIMPAAVEMMDRLTVEAAEAAVHPGFPRPGRCCIVELDGTQTEVTELFGRVEDVVPRLRRERRADCEDRRGARARSGKAARRRSPPWAACRRTTTCRTASFRARRCRRCCAGSATSSARTGCASATCSTRATATCIRSCSTTTQRAGAERARRRGRRRDPRRYCIEAGGSHHRRARRRRRQGRITCRKMFSPDRSRHDAAACGARSIRQGSAIPARSSRRRAFAGKCRVRTASTRWSGQAWPNASDDVSVGAGPCPAGTGAEGAGHRRACHDR